MFGRHTPTYKVDIFGQQICIADQLAVQILMRLGPSGDFASDAFVFWGRVRLRPGKMKALKEPSKPAAHDTARFRRVVGNRLARECSILCCSQ